MTWHDTNTVDCWHTLFGIGDMGLHSLVSPDMVSMPPHVSLHGIILHDGVGIAQWLECRTHDWNVAGSNPCWSGGRIFFSMVNFLCWLLFRYLFHPRVTAVAQKRSQSFCQKCRWQVTVKHANTLRMWLCMKWHGAWLYGVHRTCAEMAAVSCGTSRASAVSTPLWWILKEKKKCAIKLVTHVKPHASAVSLLKRAEISAV